IFFDLVRKEAATVVEIELGTLHVTSMIDRTDPNKFINLKIFEDYNAYEILQNGVILKAFLTTVDEMIIAGQLIVFEGYQMFSCDDYTLEQKSGDDISAYFKR